ncbi:hypothetical protein ACHAXH_009968 [Discostella pseudostelligera]
MDSDNDHGVGNADKYNDNDDEIDEYDDEENQIPMAVPVGGAMVTRHDDDVDDDDEDHYADAAGEEQDDDDDVVAAEVDESMVDADEGDENVHNDAEEDDDDDDEEEDAGISSPGVADDDETGSSFCGTEDVVVAPPPANTTATPAPKKRGRKKKCEVELSEWSSKKKKAKRDSTDTDEGDYPGKIRRISTNLTTGLTIPFRTIKRLMKNDTTIGIVQNDAAIVVTAALEMFVKNLAQQSLQLAANNGRNIIKYEDVATVRANDRSLSFLDLLLP